MSRYYHRTGESLKDTSVSEEGGPYSYWDSPQYLWDKFLIEPPSLMAIDTETITAKNRTLLGVAVTISQESSFYITQDDPDFPGLMEVLKAHTLKKIYHNAPFDMRVLREWGVDHYNVEDTAIMCRLLNIPAMLEEAHGHIVSFDKVRAITPKTAIGMLTEAGVKRMDQLPEKELARKCCVDAEVTLILYNHIASKVSPSNYKLERDMIPILEETSQKGVKLDQERRQQLEDYYQKEYSFYKATAEGMGFNIGSRFELGYMLAEAGTFLPFTDTSRFLKTDEKTLKKIRTPAAIGLAQMALLYRHNEGMLTRYLRPLKGATRAYTMMHMDAITGRVSPGSAGSNNPDRNLANIPKKVEKGVAPPIRSMFVGDEFPLSGLTRMDQSQVELRILAHLSQDPVMLAVSARIDGDIHRSTEEAIWGTNGPNRLVAKIFNFAMIYSYGKVATVAENIGTTDYDKVGRWINLWMSTYQGASRWMQQQIVDGIINGYVETLHGRRIPIPLDQGLEHAENCCINYPIQGTAAEIFKMLIQAVVPLLDEHRIYVHDEIVFNGDVRSQLHIEDLANVSRIRIPVEVQFGQHWAA